MSDRTKGVCCQKELGKKNAYDGSRKVEGSCQGQGFVLEVTGNDEIQPREATEEIAWSTVEMRGWFRYMSRHNRTRGPVGRSVTT
jgi:hypothetical protein